MSFLSVLSTMTLAAAMLLADELELSEDSLDKVRRNIDRERAVLVDVREQAEWDKGRIEGAHFLPLTRLARDHALADELPDDRILYIHCVSGKRALMAGEILQKLGYEVRPIEPGYKELVEAGFPTEP